MSTGDLYINGDHSSIAEELLSEIPELEQKCRTVDKAVNEGYFDLSEALKVYEVSEIEYLPYILLKNHNRLINSKKQDQVFGTIHAIVSLFDPTFFDRPSQQFLIDLKRELMGNMNSKNILVEKVR